MPLYEVVLRAPGQPDEVRISDRNGLREGDEITIANRRWIVTAKQPATTERPDRLAIEERIVVVRQGGARGSAVAALSQFRCIGCGYGASCRAAPDRCPMCGDARWEITSRHVLDALASRLRHEHRSR